VIRVAITVLACAIAYPAESAPQVAGSAALHLGDRFPHLVGPSLSGRAIDVPIVGATKPTVVIVGFSREGGNDAQQWGRRLSIASMSSETDFVIVAELESVPRLLRGAIGYTIKRGVPPSLRDHMLILERDEPVWRERLAVTSTARAYAVLVDSAGIVRWMSSGPCDDAQVAQMRAAAASSPRAPPLTPRARR
jgi:hypothetical protein